MVHTSESTHGGSENRDKILKNADRLIMEQGRSSEISYNAHSGSRNRDEIFLKCHEITRTQFLAIHTVIMRIATKYVKKEN